MTTRADIEAIRKHAVWSQLEDLQGRAAEASPYDSTDRETIARITAVTSYALAYRSFGPHLFPSSWSQDLLNLQNYVSYLSSVFGGGPEKAPLNPSSVREIDTYLDHVLTALNSFPSLQKESRAKVFAEAGDAYRLTAEASLTALQSAIEGLGSQLEEQKSVAATTLTQATAAKESASAAKKELSNLIDDADRIADEALTERTARFDARADESHDNLVRRSNEIIAALETREAKARELLEHVADASVAGGYQKYANREQKAFRLWNITGLSIAGVVAIYLAIRFWDITELTVQESILRAAISLPGLAVAAYCLRQAGLRQKEAIEAKYRELDLLALPPFTDSMNEDQKSELRMLLGTRIFAKSVQQAAEGKSEPAPLAGLSADDIAKLIQAIRPS